MWLGIDVGGTFTDAVVVAQGEILAQAKVPTTPGTLLTGILSVLDQVLSGLDKTAIRRVALSTTIVTNAVVQKKTDPVGLILMPGPGVNLRGLLPETPFIISGYVDHRGRDVFVPEVAEVISACQQLKHRPVLAVVGKFAVRNPGQELQVADWVGRNLPGRPITIGSRMSGTLNFWRRANSAYYNSAVYRPFGEFAVAVSTALRQRQLTAPVFVLKADGGTMPLAVAVQRPVEAIFTGPAASVLGIMAMFSPPGEVVSLDIGGTTTDIALWRGGAPLFATHGAWVNGFPTAVRAFWMRSIALGGDSFVRWEEDELKIGPLRRGPAMALGGEHPTVTDAMIVAGVSSFGNREAAAEGMAKLARKGLSKLQTAELVLEIATRMIDHEIEAMIAQQAAEPVYRVEDVIHSRPFHPDLLLGVGGAAAGLTPFVARRRDIPFKVPPGAMVANAVGAAVARPTTEVTLRADTEQGIYTVAEIGLHHKLPGGRFTMEEARCEARRQLEARALQQGIELEKIDTVYEEEFNLVRGFATIGKILTCSLQVKPGVLQPIVGKEGAL